MVAGTAAAVGGRVRHRQNQRWQQQAEADAYEQQAYQQQAYQQPMPPAAPPPPAAAAPAMSTVEQLTQLAALRDQGVLTDAEFDAEKAKILAAG